MQLALVVDPRSEGAFFAQKIEVARAALASLYPGVQVGHSARGGLELLELELGEDALPGLARLPFVQAVLRPLESGGFEVVQTEPGLHHPAGLVFGAKYRGKTHELVTQLAIELALSRADGPVTRLVDPMAGRGTTLLWAVRYGLDAVGVEIMPEAREHLHRHVKRQAKLHRIKHQHQQGSVGPKRADGVGRYAEYSLRPGSLRLVTGDGRDLRKLLGPRPFDALVTDLPYGVQFKGAERNPLTLLRQCAPSWASALRPGGVAVLIYNRLQPRRAPLAEAFEGAGLQVLDFEAPHRMSESIDRDLLILRKPG